MSVVTAALEKLKKQASLVALFQTDYGKMMWSSSISSAFSVLKVSNESKYYCEYAVTRSVVRTVSHSESLLLIVIVLLCHSAIINKKMENKTQTKDGG